MSAKMDLPARIERTITRIDFIPLPVPPPEPIRQAPANPSESVIDRQPVVVPVPRPPSDPIDAGPTVIPEPGGPVGTHLDTGPVIELTPAPVPVRLGPRLATPASALRPPYPASKLDRAEEAVLRLRLTIDARGRVTAVEPVGRADPAFLDAARRHLIARWRYQPASEGGRAIASTTLITLRFELNG